MDASIGLVSSLTTMSHESHSVAETIPMAIPFENALDRRRKPRIPCAGPVRLGPAHQPVRSTLLLEDLSSGGLFIRCPRPVQVGARFSIELPLPSGETLYIPEAEVIYNRSVSEELQGFGAEFVNLPAEVEAKLIDVAKFDSAIARDERDVSASMILYQESEIGGVTSGPRISDLRLSTLRPAHDTEPPTVALRVFDGTRREDVSTLRVRKDRKAKVAEVWSDLGEAPALDQELVLDTTTSGFAGELDISESETPRAREGRVRPRRARPLVLVAAGLCGFLVLGSVVLKGARRENSAHAAEAASAETNGLSAETHSMLTGRGRVELVKKQPEAPAPAESAAPKNPLPGLVDVRQLAAERQARRQPEVTPDAPVVAAEVKPAPPGAEPSPGKSAPGPVRVKAAAALVAAPVERPTPAPSSSAGADDARIRVSPGAKVLRSFVLKSPARFVVDLEQQSGAPEVEKGSARVGMHDGYTRIVIDSPRALSAGEVKQSGEWLQIRLVP